jgi:hypothetical protein
MKENPEERQPELDDQDRAINKIANQETAKEEARLAKAREIPPDDVLMKELHEVNASAREKLAAMKSRLEEIDNTLNVFERYTGSGLAEDMPLGEVIGFLETRGEMFDNEEVFKNAGRQSAEEDAIDAIMKSIVSIQEQKKSEQKSEPKGGQTPEQSGRLTKKNKLSELKAVFEEEQEDLRQTIRGEKLEINLEE